MKLVSLGAAAVRYGATTVLRDLTWTITEGDRWGIVGRNGSGKTTLLELIQGTVEVSAGSIARASGLRVAVVDQHRVFGEGDTVWDAAAGAFHGLRQLETALADHLAAMATASEADQERLLAEYSRDLERFEHEGGYALTAKVDAVLHGVGFDPARCRAQLASTLSGGERGRVALAAALAAPADLLLLDEPTNHLDLEGTQWLEEYLVTERRSVVVISHDRAFLERVTDHILHLEGGTGISYAGGYREFVHQRSHNRLTSQRAFEKQSKALAREEDYIRRNTAGHNAAQAAGRLRRLARVERLTAPIDEGGTMSMRLVPASRGGDQVVVLDRIGVAIGDRTLLTEFSGTIRRGDVVGLIGRNGVGKSTLLGALLGQRPTTSGSAKIGDSIQLCYYAQDLGDVPANQELFDIIHDLRPSWSRGQVQDHLGRFGFSGDSVRRKPESLSGGERARIALARLMLANANFLIFDEPTNHLDVETIEALEDALEGFDGTVLLVSHDRALLRSLATRIWALDGGEIEDFAGGYDDWVAARQSRRRAAVEQALEERDSSRRKPASKGAGEAATRGPRPLTAARRALSDTESAVAAGEEEVRALSRALEESAAVGSADGARRSGQLARDLERAKANLEAAMAAWERASLEVERLAAEEPSRR
ncbi:MAG: ABC-F family ATP-binding cassette domain-containing protein [Gemmatimonadetes bacterium]|nr:ABC-F family ATP-binding cassette domain-containing protein [Gemmatimonadota bacterium]